MSRRALLRVMLAAAAAPTLGVFAVRKGYPASAGTGSVQTWRWVALPGAGLEVCLTEQRDPRKVSVTWTPAGAVTAFGATVTAGSAPVTAVIGTRSISVRRILT